MFEQKLNELLAIKKSCIWIKTQQEKEVTPVILNVLNKNYFNHIYVWSFLTNLQEIKIGDNNFTKTDIPNTQGPAFLRYYNSLQTDPDMKLEEHAIILRDYDLQFENPAYIRLLREMVEVRNEKYIPLIFISEGYNPPPKLAHLFTVIEYKNPTKEEIVQLLNDYEMSREVQINDKEEVARQMLGFNRSEIIEALDLSFYKYGEINFKILNDKKIEMINKSDVIDYSVPTKTMADIGGNYSFKKWFEEIKICMNPEAKQYGVEMPKGYLALGIAGCSKSLMAEVIANELGVPFLKLNMSKILSKFVGESERKIEQAVELINASAPCVLLIDEVEKNLGGYASSNASDSGTLSRVFGKVLDMLVNNDKGIFTVMTSNNVKDLPPELTRAGRLDAIWYFSLPTEDERQEILAVHFKKRNQNVPELIVKEMAKETQGYTGAELEQIVKSSIKKAYVRKAKNIDLVFEITKKDLMDSKKEVIPISKSSKEKIMALEQWAKGRALYANDKSNNKKIDLDTIDIDNFDI